jgi:transcriptional regulator with GAF, ATPase, and Fis domain
MTTLLDPPGASPAGLDRLCDGLKAALETVRARLPLLGLGIVQWDGADRAVLSYVDATGATAHRIARGDLPDPARPGIQVPGRLVSTADGRRSLGVIGARVLLEGLPEDVRAALPVVQALTFPMLHVDVPATLIMGLSTPGEPTDGQMAVIRALVSEVGELLSGRERPGDELVRLRRLDAIEGVMPALISVLDIRQIFATLSAATQNGMPHDLLSVGTFSDDLTEVTTYAHAGTGIPEKAPVVYPREAIESFLYQILDDMPANPVDTSAEGAEAGLRAAMRLPVRLDDRVVAVLNFSSKDRARYGSVDLAVGRRIADYVALAMSHQRLAEESRRAAALEERARSLDALDGLLNTITGVLDIRDVFARVSEIASQVLPHDAMGLPIFTDDRQHVIPYATIGLPTDTFARIQPIPESQKHLLTEPWEAHISEDLQTMPDWRDSGFARAGMHSLLRVPIRIDGELVGILGFFSREVGRYTQDDAMLARRIASHVALAVSHQRLADESRRRAALQERQASLEALDGLLNTVAGVLDVRDVIDRISAIGNTVMPHDAMTIVVLTKVRGIVRLYAATGALRNLPVPAEIPIPNPDLLEGQWEFELINDIQQDARYASAPSAKAGMRSLLTMPIRVSGELLGGVNFASSAAGRFTRDDAPMARRITDHIALALQHERLAEEMRRSEELRSRTANIELLDELLAAVTDSGELRVVIDRVSEIAQKVLPHDAMVVPVLLGDRANVRFHVVRAPGATFPEVMETAPHLRNSEWEYDIADDLQADPSQRELTLAKLGYRAVLRMPIRVEGQLTAGVGFFSFTPAAYKEADVAIGRRVADRIAISLMRELGQRASKRADEAAERASRLESRVQALTDELNSRAGFHRVIGKSASWRQVLTQASQVAATETTVLLLGESGTGKEVVARFLHRASTRKNGPFVALNCAALPEQLLESELFGYERGAFTGAMVSRAGKIEQAAGGVLFLDEVGEMSPAVQAKFLRVLQEREFQRLGGSKTLKADARVIAATNRDPKVAMERGQFREDLYYRLSVFEIALPPLRDRRDDILLLVESFLADLAKSVGRPAAGLSEDAKDRLLGYAWPGNVRELRNAIERAVILCEGGLISSEHLPIAVGQARSAPAPAVVPAAAAVPAAAPAPAGNGGEHAGASLPGRGLKLDDLERDLLNKAMAQANNNKSQAAKLLGVPRGQFYSLLKKHGLTDAKR